MKKKVVKAKRPGAKRVIVPYIKDPNVSNSRIILHNKEELLDYVRDNILDVLKNGTEETYVIGFTSMTSKQLENLPDIDD